MRRTFQCDEYMAIEPSALGRAFLFASPVDFEAPHAVDAGGVARVSVLGPLEQRAGAFWDGYGGDNGIVERFKAALADERSRSVVLAIDSPGGAVAGLLEAVDAMREAKAAARKPVVAFAHGSGAYSAGYALASVADHVVVSRAGGVGSVGVIATAASLEKALEREGVAVAVVASGAHKKDMHPALPFSEAALGRYRARVNELAGLLADDVAKGRGMTREKVLGQQAALFYGRGAVDAGLADSVGTFADAAAEATRRAASGAAPAAVSIAAVAPGVPTDAEAEAALRRICAREGMTWPPTEPTRAAPAAPPREDTTMNRYEYGTARDAVSEYLAARGGGEGDYSAANLARYGIEVPDARELKFLGMTAEESAQTQARMIKARVLPPGREPPPPWLLERPSSASNANAGAPRAGRHPEWYQGVERDAESVGMEVDAFLATRAKMRAAGVLR